MMIRFLSRHFSLRN